MAADASTIDWTNLRIGMLGGDRREQEIARRAAATGADVRAYGFPWPDAGIPGVTYLRDPAAVLDNAKFALFPIPGISTSGALFAPSAENPIIPDLALLSRMAPHAHIILGWADKNLKMHADALSIKLHEYEWDRSLMLHRAPAIIEGLLRIVIENTDITIFEELPHIASRLDLLFSTVPTRVVGENVLSRLTRSALVVDLAAPPGGVDFDAAKRLGLRAVWGRGLGSRAPVTVGASQWDGIRERIEKILLEES